MAKIAKEDVKLMLYAFMSYNCSQIITFTGYADLDSNCKEAKTLVQTYYLRRHCSLSNPSCKVPSTIAGGGAVREITGWNMLDKSPASSYTPYFWKMMADRSE